MKRMSELEIRAGLLKLATLIDELDNTMHALETQPECANIAQDFDSVAALRLKYKHMRVALGYTASGVLIHARVDTPFPTLPQV